MLAPPQVANLSHYAVRTLQRGRGERLLVIAVPDQVWSMAQSLLSTRL